MFAFPAGTYFHYRKFLTHVFTFIVGVFFFKLGDYSEIPEK